MANRVSQAALVGERSPVLKRQVKAVTKDIALVREKREQLIAAAIRVFLEKGFHNATVRDIGRAADMTQGTIYNYVRSKDDILYLVCDRIVSEYQEQTRRAMEANADPTARIRSAVRAVCEVMYQHQQEILLIYQDSHLLEPRSLRVILARVEEFIGMFESIVGEALRNRPEPKPNLRLAAHIVTFLPVMLALRRWSLYRNLAHEEVVEGLTDFLVRGLGLEGTTAS